MIVGIDIGGSTTDAVLLEKASVDHTRDPKDIMPAL